MAGGKKSDVGEQTHRLTLRLNTSDFTKLKYWAEREEVSLNEFVTIMLSQWIDIQNGNYELPTLEVQRLNQLVELMRVLSQNQQSLESIIINGFDSLLSLTKGDSYLLENVEDEFDR